MDTELRRDGADLPVLGVVQTTDFGDGLGSEHGDSRLLPDRKDRSMDSYGCTPRSAKTGSGQSGRHRRSPRAARQAPAPRGLAAALAIASQDRTDRKSTRLNSSHTLISYAVFCLKKKT